MDHKISTYVLLTLICIAGLALLVMAADISPPTNLNGRGLRTIDNYKWIGWSDNNISIYSVASGTVSIAGSYNTSSPVNVTVPETGGFCLTQDCVHRIYYNGTATIIE